MLRALRRWALRPPYAPRVDLSGRRMIVTGCAPGSLGYETARSLARWGAEVVVTTRRDAAAVAAQLRAQGPVGVQVHGQDLDLCDTASVARFVAGYRATLGERLDVLVNNAGVHLDLLSQWTAPRQVDGHEIHWRTNTLGTLDLTAQLLPLLLGTARAQGEARVVTVVSELHRKGRNADLPERTRPYESWNAYGNSKLALVHAMSGLQQRHGGEGLKTFSLHPGAVYTNIADHGLSGNPRLARMRRALAPLERAFLLTPEEGAQTSLYCATQPGLHGGQYYRRCRAAAPSAEARDAAFAARLLGTLMPA